MSELNINQCHYLNGETMNASFMNKPCIGNSSVPDSVPRWPCSYRNYVNSSVQSYVTERPNGDNVSTKLPHSLTSPTQVDSIQTNQVTEGFTNLGESYVEPGGIPDGYFRRPDGSLTQVCQNCKYNQATYGKSKIFNEADPCFPHQGVYAGLGNDGYTYCTCGAKNEYCDSDSFDAQGGMMYDGIYIMNVGDFGFLGNLSSY
jgi:hypothetical protein